MLLANIFGPDVIVVVLIILAVLLFGSQAPKLARNVGLAGREFRKAQEDAEKDAAAEAAKKAAAAPAAVPQSADSDKVTLSKAELDALLTEREERARRQASSS
jgi:Sec-independent protein translocase protein TatA